MVDFIILCIYCILIYNAYERNRFSSCLDITGVWLSHGSPATTALSDEETDGEDGQEVEEDSFSLGRDDDEGLQATLSPPQALGNIPDVPSRSLSPLKR